MAIVSTVISSHAGALGSEAHGILDAMRPAIAILIPAAMAGTIVLFAVRQPGPKVQGTAALLPDFDAN